jgi:hypothetical protein
MLHDGTVIAVGQEERLDTKTVLSNTKVSLMKTLIIVRPGKIAVLFSRNLAVAASTNMRPSPPCPRLLYPRLAWSLSLIILAGLSGCGPAASDHALTPESRASLGVQSKSQPVSQDTLSPRNNSFTLVANSVSLAAPPVSNYATVPAAQEEPAPMPEHLVLPAWIALALDAPETRVRLQALDLLAQQGAQAPLDPLIVALDDKDKDVRTKAMAIIERNWAVE